MLVLSRKRNESIIIDGTIIVTLIDIRGEAVRLGITAPSEISVHREEVYETIKRNGGVARRAVPNALQAAQELNQQLAAALEAALKERDMLLVERGGKAV